MNADCIPSSPEPVGRRSSMVGRPLTRVALAVLLGLAAHLGTESIGTATTVRRMDLRDLTKSATAVLVGKCARIESRWDKRHTRILTHVHLTVSECVKGETEPVVTLTLLGGTVGADTVKVPGMPTFRVGEECVVFLWTTKTGIHTVMGLAQGKFTVHEDKQTGAKLVSRKSTGLDLVAKDGARSEDPDWSPIPLEKFLDRVREYAKEG